MSSITIASDFNEEIITSSLENSQSRFQAAQQYDGPPKTPWRSWNRLHEDQKPVIPERQVSLERSKDPGSLSSHNLQSTITTSKDRVQAPSPNPRRRKKPKSSSKQMQERNTTSKPPSLPPSSRPRALMKLKAKPRQSLPSRPPVNTPSKYLGRSQQLLLRKEKSAMGARRLIIERSLSIILEEESDEFAV